MLSPLCRGAPGGPATVPVEPAHVAIELTGTHTPGMTVTWFRHTAEGPFNAEVGIGLGAPAFWDLFVDALKRID